MLNQKLNNCILLSALCLLSCTTQDYNPKVELKKRYEKLLNYKVDSLAFPRSYNPKTKDIKKVPSKDWTSGFFAGNLWQIYSITKNEAYKNKAKEWTAFIEQEKYNNRTHDMGFKVYNSFGLGLKFEDNTHYKNVLIKSAKTLISRYNDTVGSIRSWDFNKKDGIFR
jgi:hypothetical protein